MDRVHQLYQVTAPDGRSYIGCTRYTADRRWRTHYAHPGPWPGDDRARIGDAIKHFGRDAFSFEHIASAMGQQNAAALERQLIEERGTRWPAGYNRDKGGGGLFRVAA